ncbi:hypothetical protein P153DRAFT_115891 [Dothidotthia symphoricarpi CBS 119687]|uniref:RING-type domain-containing protein n=1 Tax=Dothidotthia symphoricarpi CBS 119687 TaxID=1392245 RepID=A0A6A6A352_9PLEO|nr:uncharacterized protein P153DRAFT_115891 [Dothidotthia symphoricarpi CBS 119687]KAF2125593.1 hypothetical protein P153DRAFT_115891 [Dothidotthia symphoricarpi CBS 119687]
MATHEVYDTALLFYLSPREHYIRFLQSTRSTFRPTYTHKLLWNPLAKIMSYSNSRYDYGDPPRQPHGMAMFPPSSRRHTPADTSSSPRSASVRRPARNADLAHRFCRAGIEMWTQHIPPQVAQRIKSTPNFTCPICLDDTPNPIINLPCGHTLCKRCTTAHYEEGGLNGGDCVCPVCRGSMQRMTDYKNFLFVFDPNNPKLSDADFQRMVDEIERVRERGPRRDARAPAHVPVPSHRGQEGTNIHGYRQPSAAAPRLPGGGSRLPPTSSSRSQYYNSGFTSAGTAPEMQMGRQTPYHYHVDESRRPSNRRETGMYAFDLAEDLLFRTFLRGSNDQFESRGGGIFCLLEGFPFPEFPRDPHGRQGSRDSYGQQGPRGGNTYGPGYGRY